MIELLALPILLHDPVLRGLWVFQHFDFMIIIHKVCTVEERKVYFCLSFIQLVVVPWGVMDHDEQWIMMNEHKNLQEK
jgi:hypothetical protein